MYDGWREGQEVLQQEKFRLRGYLSVKMVWWWYGLPSPVVGSVLLGAFGGYQV